MGRSNSFADSSPWIRRRHSPCSPTSPGKLIRLSLSLSPSFFNFKLCDPILIYRDCCCNLFQILAPRIGYLPLLASHLKSHFSSALPPRLDTIWFEYKGLPLKWYVICSYDHQICIDYKGRHWFLHAQCFSVLSNTVLIPSQHTWLDHSLNGLSNSKNPTSNNNGNFYCTLINCISTYFFYCFVHHGCFFMPSFSIFVYKTKCDDLPLDLDVMCQCSVQ